VLWWISWCLNVIRRKSHPGKFNAPNMKSLNSQLGEEIHSCSSPVLKGKNMEFLLRLFVMRARMCTHTLTHIAHWPELLTWLCLTAKRSRRRNGLLVNCNDLHKVGPLDFLHHTWQIHHRTFLNKDYPLPQKHTAASFKIVFLFSPITFSIYGYPVDKNKIIPRW
jgi:hypothetical protein